MITLHFVCLTLYFIFFANLFCVAKSECTSYCVAKRGARGGGKLCMCRWGREPHDVINNHPTCSNYSVAVPHRQIRMLPCMVWHGMVDVCEGWLAAEACRSHYG